MSEFKDLRIEAKMSVTELHRASGVSISTLQRMERGQKVRPELVQKACEILAQKLERTDISWKTVNVVM